MKPLVTVDEENLTVAHEQDPTGRVVLLEHDIVNEIDRYLLMPGQALAYKVGQLKILALRDRAQRQLGENFDIRAFHDHLLGAGALPLDLLEQRMDAWLASQLAVD